eukprot:758862-Hanusia_phi.AAC.3
MEKRKKASRTCSLRREQQRAGKGAACPVPEVEWYPKSEDRIHRLFRSPNTGSVFQWDPLLPQDSMASLSSHGVSKHLASRE